MEFRFQPDTPMPINDHFDDAFEAEAVEADDHLPPPLSSRIAQLSRKWTNDDEDRRAGRPQRRARRRIEDWREARSLARDLEDDFDRD
jgi:hypothetical protein